MVYSFSFNEFERPYRKLFFTNSAACGVRHELVEIIRACPVGGGDWRRRLFVIVRSQAGTVPVVSEQITAEYRVTTQGRGRTIDAWKMRPEQSDNHWLDCLVGCAVAASIQGAVLFGTGPTPVQKERKHRRRTLAEMRQQKRGH